jgi:hypothetical protein
MSMWVDAPERKQQADRVETRPAPHRPCNGERAVTILHAHIGARLDQQADDLTRPLAPPIL